MSDDTIVADPPAAAPPPPADKPGTSGADKVRFVLRGIGQTLITLGLVVLLFVVYEVWITNIFSRDANNRAAHKLDEVWQNDDPLLGLPGGGSSTIPLGTGIANIYLPRLGTDYHWTVVEGVGQDDLAKGPGHYPGTALPGEKGNFGVAGHRVGKGEPFLNLDKLKANDTIIIETKSWWYVYRVKGTENGLERNDADGVPGREIVEPSAGRVLLPLPNHADVTKEEATERLLTLTTCHPKFTAAKRMIIHAVLGTRISALDAQRKHVKSMPAAIKKLYSEVSV